MKDKYTNTELLAVIKERFEENEKMLAAERKLAQELNAVNNKLLASEQLKSNFLSNIRNEINNPLSAILELTKSIAEGGLSQEAVIKYASLVYLEAFDLDFQLRNIFLSAEIEAGESPLSVSKVNIVSLIEGLVQSFTKKATKKGIDLRFSSNEKAIHFPSDNEKLHLILANLVANAIQFNKEGGSVDISIVHENDQCVIRIKDTGIGIPQDEFERIFDRFYQVESGSTKTYMGHGLGLSITKALLDIINAEISLESEVGIGSEFTITLNPLVDESGLGDTFSGEGNDFLFDQDEDDMLF
jgi:signal transduction histidine kinase